MMTSRPKATRDPATKFPNANPALYRSGFGVDTLSNGNLSSLLSDRHPASKKKKKNKPTLQNGNNSISMMASLGHTNVYPSKSLSIEEHWDPGFIINDMDPGGDVTACIRATKKLQDADTWLHLTAVRELTIDDEQDSVNEFPEEIYSLKDLRVLSIRWSSIRNLSPELASMQLTQLNLSNNKLESVNAVTLMKSLTVLNLSMNSIQILPPSIGDLNYLRELNVNGNTLKELPDRIGDLTMLVDLQLSSNKLKSLPSSIGSLCELCSFDVTLNKLSSLPKEIGSLGKLKTLLLSYNRLSGLPETFSGLTELKWLFVRKNKFTEVPKVLSLLPNLQVLNMNDNSISNVPAPTMPLRHLLLDANKLKTVPENVLACSNLETLSLERNSISKVPKDICRLASLRALHLGGNEFGEVPPDLGELQELRHLTLNDNEIQHLPSDFVSLRRLSVLNLENTPMNGAWMSAYRQGIPAVLEYAKTIRQRHPDKNGLITPKGSPFNLRKKDKKIQRQSNLCEDEDEEAGSRPASNIVATPTLTLEQPDKGGNLTPKGSPWRLRRKDKKDKKKGHLGGVESSGLRVTSAMVATPTGTVEKRMSESGKPMEMVNQRPMSCPVGLRDED